MCLYSRFIFVMTLGLVVLKGYSTPSSWLVYEGINGLEYAGYANEGQTNAVNTVPDFSSAGYQGGGVAIPFIPEAVRVSNGSGDDTVRIQNAIDTVSALPIGPDGFRGAVVLSAGSYTVSNTLTIAASGVVIRGEGSQLSGGTVITYTATTKSNLFEVDNDGDRPREVNSTKQSITDSYVPVGAKSFNVADASAFAPGDQILIQNLMNQKWIDDISNMGQWGWTTNSYQLRFRRTITAVNGTLVTIDAPIIQTIEDQYGSGAIYTYNFTGELEHIGFEGLQLLSSYTHSTDENHGWEAIQLNGLKNGWVRQVTCKYFGLGLVNFKGNCRHITVEDCAMLDPKSITDGGRKYSFSINKSDSILIQRCLTRGGRHDFATGSVTPGPNVFLDCRANAPSNDIGPHHRYATGQLYDNIKGGKINVQNRTNWGSGHGWAGAQVMFWNLSATSIICDAPTGAMNWCVGSSGFYAKGTQAPNEPNGICDSHYIPVLPRSLYHAQLSERLGERALNNIILPQQKMGKIWTELNSWNGSGLFLDGLVTWLESDPITLHPVSIRGVVRDLQLLDSGVTSSWSFISGPGAVSFVDSAALETTATFSLPGSYVLQLTAGTYVSSLSIEVVVAGANQLPIWSSNPILEVNGMEGAVYNGTLANYATDLDNDLLTFLKLSGPAWLSIASDGVFSGSPSVNNAGLNTFVVTVADGIDAAVSNTLEITVNIIPDRILLVGDVAGSSGSRSGGSILNTANDLFAYDSDAPTAVLPAQHWAGSAGFHGNNADGEDVVLVYTFTIGSLNLSGGEFYVDLYGRDMLNDRCQDIDIELYSGGVSGTRVSQITGVYIAESAPYHVRAILQPATAFDTLVVIGHDTTAASGNSFTLMEIVTTAVSALISPYNEWIDSHPGLGSSVDLMDDADADGVVNLVEYALGGNPLIDDSAHILPDVIMTTDAGTNWLYYSYSRRENAAALGLTYTVLSGADLVGGGLTNEVPPFGVSALSDGFESVTNRIPADTQHQQFMELKVQLD